MYESELPVNSTRTSPMCTCPVFRQPIQADYRYTCKEKMTSKKLTIDEKEMLIAAVAQIITKIPAADTEVALV